MRVVLLVFVLAGEAVLAAHDLAELTAPRALSPFDIAVIVFLATAGGLYAVGSWRLARRGARRRALEPIAFAVGWATLMLTALPPIDALAIQLFSAHMAQHELMMLMGAPLIMAGRPIPVWLAALPASLKRHGVAMLQARTTDCVWHLLTAPLVAWTLHGAAIWIWHLPPLYDLAVDNEAVAPRAARKFRRHGDPVLVGTALRPIWPRGVRRRGVLRLHHGSSHRDSRRDARVRGTPLYKVYLQPAAARGIDPLGDQQRAGLIMWIPAGLILTTLGIALVRGLAWRSGTQDRAPSH
jgi:cytochrome c oxidase assembly factor CtaG